VVSAWAESKNLVLRQLKVADKSNEITAVPELLRVLELSGCIVTLDAMGCQKKIAREIIEADADDVSAELAWFADVAILSVGGALLPGVRSALRGALPGAVWFLATDLSRRSLGRRRIIATAIAKFLECGDLKQGFARVRCPKCQHEMFVAFSCRGRCVCPSCHEKRALEKAAWVSEHVCAEVPHRQFVFTMPNIRSWKHSGFSVDQSVRLEAGDRAGIQRLI